MSRRVFVGPHYWGIVGPGNWLIPSTIRSTRREVIVAFEDDWQGDWVRCRRQGWRVAKVRIVPFEESNT